METKQPNINKGVWKRDPRGVDYITFTSNPDVSGDTETFEFKLPRGEEKCFINITNTEKVLGVIVLIRPENYGD